MALYELVVIARSDLSEQQAQDLMQQYKSVIEKGDGKVSKTEYAGLKSLAYRIKKNKKGHYMLLNIEAQPPVVQEVERQMRINENVLRYLTIKVEALDDTPSALTNPNKDREILRDFAKTVETSEQF